MLGIYEFSSCIYTRYKRKNDEIRHFFFLLFFYFIRTTPHHATRVLITSNHKINFPANSQRFLILDLVSLGCLLGKLLCLKLGSLGSLLCLVLESLGGRLLGLGL